MPIDARYRAASRAHAGLVMVSSKTFPQSRGYVSAVTSALDALLAADGGIQAAWCSSPRSPPRDHEGFVALSHHSSLHNNRKLFTKMLGWSAWASDGALSPRWSPGSPSPNAAWHSATPPRRPSGGARAATASDSSTIFP